MEKTTHQAVWGNKTLKHSQDKIFRLLEQSAFNISNQQKVCHCKKTPNTNLCVDSFLQNTCEKGQ